MQDDKKALAEAAAEAQRLAKQIRADARLLEKLERQRAAREERERRR